MTRPARHPAAAAHPGITVREGPPSLRALAGAIALLVAMVVIAHWPALESRALAMDDADFVTENRLISSPGWTSLRRIYSEVLEPSSVRGYYLPVTMSSLMLDWALGGRPHDLMPFHRTSLVLHCCASVLVMLCVLALSNQLALAAVAGALFGLHPLTVQPVAWLAERKTLLATVFALASIWCYMRSVRPARMRYRVVSIACFAVAALCKPSVLALPFVLLVLEWWAQSRLTRQSLIALAPYVVVMCVGAGLAAASLSTSEHIVPAQGFGPMQLFMQVTWLVSFYASKIVAPFHLSPVYAPPAPYSWSNVPLVAAMAGCVAGLSALVVWGWRRRSRSPLAVPLLVLCGLAPTFAILRWSSVIAYDNYVYFPLALLMIALAYSLGSVSRRWLLTGAACLCLCAAWVTRGTYTMWSTSTSLWRQAVATAPTLPAAHNGLAVALIGDGDHSGAMAELDRAVAIDSGYVQARVNRGSLWVRLSRPREAMADLAAARRLQPDNAGAFYWSGLAAQLAGELGEAERMYRGAIELRPDYIEARNRLGTLLVIDGRFDEGVAIIRESLIGAPSNAHTHFSLAMVLLHRGGFDVEAMQHLESAIANSPSWSGPVEQAAWLKATSKTRAVRDPESAIALLGRLDAKSRRRARVLDIEAAALAALGRYAEATRVAEQALAAAQQAGDDSAAAGIRRRLPLYKSGKAYEG